MAFSEYPADSVRQCLKKAGSINEKMIMGVAEATLIAGENPVFEDGTKAKIEVCPCKVMKGING